MIARWAPSVLAGLVLCAAPLWLWAGPLRWYALKADDFVYIARSRTPAALSKYLFAAHNGHVVPLFRLETHLLTRLAGSLEAIPVVLGWASYATLVLAMASVGHLVARETGRIAPGLAAMSAVGLSTVLGPALLWYSAGQALAAGTMVILMLIALQFWRMTGAYWAFAMAMVAALAAPFIWSGGFAAGPVGIAYLWADGRRSPRRASAWLAIVAVASAGLAWSMAGRDFAPASHVAERPMREVFPIVAAVSHMSQAICEALILNNLGLDAATTAGQGAVFCGMLAAVWWWSRRPRGAGDARTWPRINPMEAAGAALVLTTFGLIFSARGTEFEDFDSLRALGWYDAMAELGAVLFAFGWWAGDRLPSTPARPSPTGRVGLMAVLLFAGTMLALQAPRADRIVFAYDGLAASIGPPSPGPVALRTPADLEAQARAQRAALAALDRLEASARRGEIEPVAIRTGFRWLDIPGMPPHLPNFDPSEMLDIPADPQHPR